MRADGLSHCKSVDPGVDMSVGQKSVVATLEEEDVT